MIVYKGLENIKKRSRAVALGNFDGVHIAHVKLIDMIKKRARDFDLEASVFTFKNHPKKFIPGSEILQYINDTEKNMEIFENLGIDSLVMISFDEAVQHMSPEDFVKDIVVEKLGAKYVCIGYDYRFGFKGEGDVSLLKSLGKIHGFNVDVIDKVSIGGVTVSSSRIRTLIKIGDFSQVQRLLGRHYMIAGKVVHGESIGRKLGFRTLNILPRKDLCIPSDGVYVTRTRIAMKSKVYDSITNIGTRPTFGGGTIAIETNVFDFNEDIYGDIVHIDFLKKIRDEVKFSTLEELSRQIAEDVRFAKQVHSEG